MVREKSHVIPVQLHSTQETTGYELEVLTTASLIYEDFQLERGFDAAGDPLIQDSDAVGHATSLSAA